MISLVVYADFRTTASLRRSAPLAVPRLLRGGETAAIATEKPAFNKIGQPRESLADRKAALLAEPWRRRAWAWRDGRILVTDMATAIGWLASFYPENQLADLAERTWIRLENGQFELVPDVGPNGDPGEPPPAEDDEQEG